MKGLQRCLAALLIFNLFLTVCGCAENTEGQLSAAVEPTTHTDYPGVQLQILEINEVKSLLQVRLQNDTDYPVGYGVAYDIQRRVEGQWKSCAVEELAFITIAYSLNPHDYINRSYHLQPRFDLSQPGQYRIILSCTVQEQMDKSIPCTLWASFSVTGDMPQPEDEIKDLWQGAQYIRTNGGTEKTEYPAVKVFLGKDELDRYYENNKATYDLERRETVYSDSSIGFLDACDKYDDVYFDKNCLVVLLLEESSGSVRHEVTDVVKLNSGKLKISLERNIPEIGTDDMAQWHIFVEVSKQANIALAEDVKLYIDGIDISKVPTVQPRPCYEEPPTAMLYHSHGAASLHASGYHWTYDNGDGTMTGTIADAAHPLYCKDTLKPIHTMESTVKLTFPEQPDTVSVRCWPDTAWERSDVPEEKIAVSDFVFDLKPGGYIYEVQVGWQDRGGLWHGGAQYYFYAVAGSTNS